MPTDSVRAVIIDPNAPGRLALGEAPQPQPAPSEALVRVEAASLNLGEIRRAQSANAGTRIGWDFAGTVERQAADGTGPAAGTRVVGMLDTGAWAEVIAAPSRNLAALPDAVSFAQAATLPVAGLTALRSLERGGLLLERPVLVTGASGGVGQFALQLARNAGARSVGVVHRPEREAAARASGANEVVVGDDLEPARQYGPYHLILESVGGPSFGPILSMLAPGGTCVMYGTSAGADLSFEGRTFYSGGGQSLYGFFLFYELARNPAAEDLGRLARMLATGSLTVHIDVEESWTEVGRLAQDLWDRKITGKAVMRFS